MYGALLLIVAIAGLHFTAMSAVTVYSKPMADLNNGVDELLLAIAIAGLSIVIAAMTISMSLGDNPRLLWRRYAIALFLFLATGTIVFSIGYNVEVNRTKLTSITSTVSQLQTLITKPLPQTSRVSRFESELNSLDELIMGKSAVLNKGSIKGEVYDTYTNPKAEPSIRNQLFNFAENGDRISSESGALNQQLDILYLEASKALHKIESQAQITWFFMGTASLLLFIFQGIGIFWPAHSSIIRTFDEIESRKEQAERLALVAEHTSDALFVTSANGIIKWANNAAFDLLNLDMEDLEGTEFRGYLSEGSSLTNRTMKRTLSKLQNGENVHFEERFAKAEHREDAWVNISLSPIFNFDGELQQIIVAARNITEQKALESKILAHRDDLAKEVKERTQTILSQSLKLEQALTSERELNQLQSEFVSMASHEFRTPLTIIDGLARSLEKRADKFSAEEIREKAGSIRSSIVRMTMLIERTLDASRLSSGRIKLAPFHFNAKQLVEDVCGRQSEISERHTIHLDIEDYPATLFGDEKLLDNVFTNLLSNAVKYSPDRPEVFVKGWVDDYITKPIDFEMLLVTVQTRLREVDRMTQEKEEQMVSLYTKVMETKKQKVEVRPVLIVTNQWMNMSSIEAKLKELELPFITQYRGSKLDEYLNQQKYSSILLTDTSDDLSAKIAMHRSKAIKDCSAQKILILDKTAQRIDKTYWSAFDAVAEFDEAPNLLQQKL